MEVKCDVALYYSITDPFSLGWIFHSASKQQRSKVFIFNKEQEWPVGIENLRSISSEFVNQLDFYKLK